MAGNKRLTAKGGSKPQRIIRDVAVDDNKVLAGNEVGEDSIHAQTLSEMLYEHSENMVKFYEEMRDLKDDLERRVDGDSAPRPICSAVEDGVSLNIIVHTLPSQLGECLTSLEEIRQLVRRI